jgi:hypothetical protein
VEAPRATGPQNSADGAVNFPRSSRRRTGFLTGTGMATVALQNLTFVRFAHLIGWRWGRGMTGLRLAALLAIIVALIDGTLGDAKSQAVDTQRPKSPAQLAADIARTISISASRVPPNAPVAFGSATSHDKSVEVKYLIRDLNLFSLVKNRHSDEKVRVTKASTYCTESNMAAMTQGVVIHEIAALPDDSDQIDFTIDLSTCDMLPKPQPADAATLAELARNVAKVEGSRRAQPGAAFRLDDATARDGVVEERLVVRDMSAKDEMLADRAHFEGVQKNYFCPTFRNVMLRGMTFHLVFVSQDGSPVLDVAINRSNC